MENQDPNYFLKTNLEAWENRTKNHVDSDFYDVEGFKQGENKLCEIEMEFLQNIQGESILHLQCHFGIDTLCMARMGAAVTGIDFSPTAIEKAQTLAKELQLNAQFICSNVLNALDHIQPASYDMVFTSYGTIGWFPDLKPWAEVIAGALKPGGTFLFAEFHPVVWMFDNDLQQVAYSYFNREAIVENSEGSYADRNSGTKETTVTWNHSLDEVYGALRAAGLNIHTFKEYDYSPYNCLPNLVPIAENKYQVKGMEGKLPMVYLMLASKP